ncbi:hypothetical protein PLESTB_001325500 [Pleodorina starrii]|uniref:LysM domain-containing protein n=1 Tax=Pleodorina starrii TaxID=330485 RepID=A0A9W6BUR5_9CHLO|nr:hypothetical protein PLESTB_001325500 [Pleodorina starrii]
MARGSATSAAAAGDFLRLMGLLLTSTLLMTTLLAGLAATASAAGPVFKPPFKVSAAPATVVASLKAQSSLMVSSLQSMVTQNSTTAYQRFLVSFKKVSIPPKTVDPARLALFTAGLQKVAMINSRNLSYAAAVNKFMDATADEMRKVLGLRLPANGGRRSLLLQSAADGDGGGSVPQTNNGSRRELTTSEGGRRIKLRSLQATDPGDASLSPDWSTILPTIKDQGQCGSCWAFASVAVTEAAHYQSTSEVVSLSEKELVDCNTDNWGCSGGWPPAALDYIKSKGVASSGAYPYVVPSGVRDQCLAGLAARSSFLQSYRALTSNDENGMLQALNVGPILVGITVDDNFMRYGGGVFTSTDCGGIVNHAVLVVGAGVDKDTGLPFWLIRNSWGAWWGENGYIRIRRGASGPGMCNLATYAWQAISADVPGSSPPAPPDNNGCTGPTTYTYTGSESLESIAIKFRTTISQILIDNNLTPSTGRQPRIGSQLKISCPVGNWSAPYGTWSVGWEVVTASPSVFMCPRGQYAVSFTARPGRWWTTDNWTGSTWIGTVTMACSDGSRFTVDAQPGKGARYGEGTLSSINGFSSISFRSGWAIDGLFDIGARSGSFQQFSCPPDTVITGFAAGVYAFDFVGDSWIANLQFQCQNPFASVSKLRAVRAVSSLKGASGLSCKAYTATSNDSWFSIATSKGVDLNELLRANPGVTRAITEGTTVFLPPCNNGAVLTQDMVKSNGGRRLALEQQ